MYGVISLEPIVYRDPSAGVLPVGVVQADTAVHADEKEIQVYADTQAPVQADGLRQFLQPEETAVINVQVIVEITDVTGV